MSSSEPQQPTTSSSSAGVAVRNTRHGIPERSTIRDLMVHEGQTHLDMRQGPVEGATASKWMLPRRARTDEHFHAARAREGLSKGFAAFYGDDDANASARDGFITSKQNKLIGDTAKKHFEQKPSEEQQWKRGFKPTLPEIAPPRPRGKRNVPPSDQRPPHEEISDIPRGKKHVTPPIDQLTGGGVPTANVDANSHHHGEASIMGRKKAVLDPVNNVPVSWKGPPFFPPTEADETLFDGLRNRTVNRTEDQKRNGIPCKVPGDLPYKTVEQAPGYVQSMNPKTSKCGYEKPAPAFVFRDKFSVKESSARRTQEISDVRSLPNY